MTTERSSRRRGFRPLLAVAVPLAGVQLAQVALTTTDLVMMGALSVEAIAAGGLAILLHNQVRTMCVGIVTPVGNLVSGAVGRHEKDADRTSSTDDTLTAEVRSIVRAAFAVATLTGVLAAGVLVGIGFLLPLFGQRPDVVSVALPVMATLAPGLVPMLWLNVLRQFAVGMHRAGSLLAVTVASVGVNLVLDGGFLYGWFGLPVIGVAGIGVATSLVQLLNVLAYLVIVRRDPALRPSLSLQGWRADRARVREIVRLGAPVSLTYGSEAGITSVATLIIGTFGPVALAAHNVVNQIAYIVYQTMIGLSQGSSILISRSAGREEHAEAVRVARRAFVLAGALQAVLAVVYVAAPTAVLSLFLDADDPVVIATATSLLFLAIAQQVTKGAQNIGVGLMRGLGDTRAGFRASLIGYWAVGVPAMLVFAVFFDWRTNGVWLGLCCGFGTTAVVLLRRFTRATAPVTQTVTTDAGAP